MAVKLDGQSRCRGADFADEAERFHRREYAHGVGKAQPGQAIGRGGDGKVAQETQVSPGSVLSADGEVAKDALIARGQRF